MAAKRNVGGTLWSTWTKRPLRAASLLTFVCVALIYLYRRASHPAAVDPSTSSYSHYTPPRGTVTPGSKLYMSGRVGGGGVKGGTPATVSYWHGVPLYPPTPTATATRVVTFVCEIPHGGTAKLEVSKGTPLNPIIQDMGKGGAPRHYPWRSLLNYGMLPQTYEDPTQPQPTSGLPGDGDPLDAIDLWPTPCTPGEVYGARVVGALGMLDGGATDWKIVVVRDNGGIPSAVLSDLTELMSALDSLEEEGAERGERERVREADRSPQVLRLPPRGGGGGTLAAGSQEAEGGAAMPVVPPPPTVGGGHTYSTQHQHPPPPYSGDPVGLCDAMAASLPPPALAQVLATALHALPPTEGSLGWSLAAQGAGGEGVVFAAPGGSSSPLPPPGSNHVTSPPSLLPALTRLALGGTLSLQECGVVRNNVRVWAAVRLSHVREWFTWYKAGEVGGGVSQFLWGGAFLDAHSAWGIVEEAHGAWGAWRDRGGWDALHGTQLALKALGEGIKQ